MLVMIDEQGGVITLDGRLALNEDIDGQVSYTSDSIQNLVAAVVLLVDGT